ncbi:hypothetical protein HEP87_56575 [Streptomyces sp. S1D4-11]
MPGAGEGEQGGQGGGAGGQRGVEVEGAEVVQHVQGLRPVSLAMATAMRWEA